MVEEHTTEATKKDMNSVAIFVKLLLVDILRNLLTLPSHWKNLVETVLTVDNNLAQSCFRLLDSIFFEYAEKRTAKPEFFFFSK
jgi:hypothetical protein